MHFFTIEKPYFIVFSCLIMLTFDNRILFSSMFGENFAQFSLSFFIDDDFFFGGGPLPDEKSNKSVKQTGAGQGQGQGQGKGARVTGRLQVRVVPWL